MLAPSLRPRDSRATVLPSPRSLYVVSEFLDAGIGRLIGRPSTIGEAQPPAAEPKPLRLNTNFIAANYHTPC